MRPSPDVFIGARFERLEDVFHDHHERAALELQLVGYLQRQRWFGGQARALQAVTLERWISMESGASLCVVGATDVTGNVTEHQVYLYAGSDEGGQRAVLDGLTVGAVRAELLGLARGGGRIEGYRAALICEPTGVEIGDGCDGEGRLMGVEQSNTSAVFGEACAMKVYRRLERGANPDTELGLYLTTEAGFSSTPQVLAVGRLESADGFHADALVLQRYIPNSGDGWAWALDAAGRALATSWDRTAMRAWLEGEDETLGMAGRLGETTARLHATLGAATQEDVRPEPVTEGHLVAWADGLRREAEETLSLAQRAGVTDHDLLSAIRGVVEGEAAVALGAAGDAGLSIRVHGDYHLGQVLRGEDGRLYVLDFEGEPARALLQRRQRQHPLVDVAGMVRSLSYAAHTAGRDSEAREALEEWEAAVRARFLEAYYAALTASRAGILPRDEAARDRLLAHFELRKALYEVRYELNNRPDWLAIPAAGVRRLAGAGG